MHRKIAYILIALQFLLAGCGAESVVNESALDQEPAEIDIESEVQATATATQIPVEPLPESSARDRTGTLAMIFGNNTQRTVSLVHVDSNGGDIPFAELAPNGSASYQSQNNSLFRVYENSQLIYAFSLAQTNRIDLDEATISSFALNYPEELGRTLSSSAMCKLLNQSQRPEVYSGFPQTVFGLSSIGDTVATVLFIDFEDVPAQISPEDAYALIEPGTSEFIEASSYGGMTLLLEPHFAWLRMSNISTDYNNRTFNGQRAILEEAVSLSDDLVDFSKTDQLIVITNPRSRAQELGPSYNPVSINNGIEADGNIIVNGTTSGYDLNTWGYLWLNHELGHNLGLSDLYLYGFDWPDLLSRTVGEFSVMGSQGHSSIEHFAWERWVLGWLADDQIQCMDQGESTHTLSPISQIGGQKAVVVRLDDHRALVVESRRQLGYNTMASEGALVYLVDVAINSGEGPLVVFPGSSGTPVRTIPLGQNESYTFENVSVTVLDSNQDGDTLQITIAEE
jgi:M6 family metalloprotease-like protein